MAWELDLMRWAEEWWSSPVLDHALPWLTHLGSYIAVLLFILVLWILTKQRKILLRLLLLYGIQSGVLHGLKYLIHRQRPLFFLGMAPRFSEGPGEILNPSFPSGHTVYAFMMATLLSFWFPRYRVIFYISAAFIGWTRIYLTLHYPTDVIAGAVLGYGITKIYSLYFPLSPGSGKGN